MHIGRFDTANQGVVEDEIIARDLTIAAGAKDFHDLVEGVLEMLFHLDGICSSVLALGMGFCVKLVEQVAAYDVLPARICDGLEVGVDFQNQVFPLGWQVAVQPFLALNVQCITYKKSAQWRGGAQND